MAEGENAWAAAGRGRLGFRSQPSAQQLLILGKSSHVSMALLSSLALRRSVNVRKVLREHCSHGSRDHCACFHKYAVEPLLMHLALGRP